MKIRLSNTLLIFSLCLFIGINSFSQGSFKLIQNPENGKGIQGSNIVYNNKLYSSYKMRSDSVSIIEYDGTSNRLLKIPNGLPYIYPFTYAPSYKFKPFFNGKTFFQAGTKGLVEFDGDSLRFLQFPISNSYTGIINGMTALKNKLYFGFSNSWTGKQIAVYDGKEIKLISNSNIYNPLGIWANFQSRLYCPIELGSDKIGVGIFDGSNWSEIDFAKVPLKGIGWRGDMAEFNNKIYFAYFGSPNLVSYDGKNITYYPHPLLGDKLLYYGGYFNLNDKLFFTYRTIHTSGLNVRYQLGTVINDTIVLIDNPDKGVGIGGQSGVEPTALYFPTNFKNNVYFKYVNQSSKTQLAKFDGSKITLINNPSNTNGFKDDVKPIVYQNAMFVVFRSNDNQNKIYRYDGSNFTQLEIPYSGTIGRPLGEFSWINYNNKLYFEFTNEIGQTSLIEYSEVNTIKAPTVLINANNICNGDSLLLKSDKPSGNIWYFNDIEIENENKDFIYAKEGGYYSVAYRNANLDVSPKSTPIKITVNYNFTSPSISTKDSLNICSGTKITLKSSLKSGIQWYKDNSPITSTTDSTIITSSPGTYLAKTLSNGCYSESSNSLIVKIKSEPPKPIFNTTNFSFCQGDTLKLSITNVNKKDTLRWFFNNKVDSSNTSTKNFIDTAKVYVTRKDSASCTITSDTIILLKKELPKSPTLSRDSENNLVSNYSIGNKWFKDGARIADTTQKIKPTTNGLYSATSTQNGCTSLISQGYYYLTNSVSNLSSNEYLNVSPNPTEGYLYFTFKIENLSNIFIDVIDANGRVVFSRKMINDGQKLDISSLPNGNYFLHCRNNRGKLLKLINILKR